MGVQAKSEILNFWWKSFHVKAKSEIYIFQWSWDGWSSFYVQGQIQNLKCFSEGWGIGHLTMFRPNSEIYNFQWGWGVSHLSYVQAKSEALKISVRVGGEVILPCPGQIWNLKMFQWGLGGQGHLTMSRPNLKFKTFRWGWGVQAKSEI